MNILGFGRRQEGTGAVRTLVEEVRRLNARDSPGLLIDTLKNAKPDDVRDALKVLLAEPEKLFTDVYWRDPISGIARVPSVQAAAADPEVARLAARGLIKLHHSSRSSEWQRFEVLGKLLLVAIRDVSDAELQSCVRALADLIDYINSIDHVRIAGLVLPPPPPPRFVLEAVGVLQARNADMAWAVIDRLEQGPSSLARVLREVSMLVGDPAAMHDHADQLLRFIELASDLKATPTKSWLREWETLRATAGPSFRDALVKLTMNGEVTPDLTYGGSGTDIPRAAMIALASWSDDGTRAFLRKAILNWARSGVGSPQVGTAAVWALASYGDRAAVASMLDIRRRIRHKNLLKRLDREIERLSAELGVTADDIGDESVDDCGLDAEGKRTWKLGDRTATLLLGDQGRIERTDLPATVRKQHPREWADILAAGKLLKETVSAQRQRLEQAMVDSREWPIDRWDAMFRGHPILWNLARRLVWRGGEELAMPTAKGWTAPVGSPVKIAHPVEMSAAEQATWQRRIVAEGIVQPFKQVFRETYFVTPAEILERDRSHRFSGHVVQDQLMYALAKGRGWSGTMGLSGFDGAGRGTRDFPAWHVQAFIEQDWTGAEGFSTIAEVSFVRTDEAAGKITNALEDIPAIPFSETMRDLDLVVAVASIGSDQQWLDWEARREAGTVDWTEQQRAYASLAAASSKIRAQLLNEMLPKLGLSDRATVEGHFVHVHGRRADYRIHLGSGNIHMEPSGRYLCIVPAPVREDRKIYLPFEDPDLKSAEVLSKVMLLVNDDKITDPVIKAQMGRS